ncbi:hypothetical protein [Xanthomonas vesicatoria]|uniref:hypothetical protein n=1 Tax=Xanthomonas vesicatoria TaxID=56460 RepID=UPI000B241446|nr:hypothetical protein [Xanthomonas vesicatoria]
MAASMPPHGPAIGEDTASGRLLALLLKNEITASRDLGVAGCYAETLRTDQLDRPLPAHRRGTFGGMNAAKELTKTYLQRVP